MTIDELNKLTDDEVRVRVAERLDLGCRAFKDEYDEQHDQSSCQDYFTYYAIPNYPADLNAMNEAEKMLNANLEAMYYDRLCSIAGVAAYRATARQRAIAFLAVTEQPMKGR